MVEQALTSLLYVIEHPYNFRSQFQPIFINLMSCVAMLVTQAAAIMVLITSANANDSIASYCNFMIVVQLPQTYFQSISDCEVKREMDTAEDKKVIRSRRHLYTYNSTVQTGEDAELTETNTKHIRSVAGNLWWVKGMWYFAKLLKFIYEIVYFYFTPFAIIVFHFGYISYFKKWKKFTPTDVPEPDKAE